VFDAWGYDPDPGPSPAFASGQRVIVDHPWNEHHGLTGTVIALVEDDDRLRYAVKLENGLLDEFEGSELEAT